MRTILTCFGLSLLLPAAAQTSEADTIFVGKNAKRRAIRAGYRPPREATLGEGRATGAALRRVNNSALNAVAIDVEALQRSNLNVADALDKISGVKIRQSGGEGSETSLNLNGFTGRHVRLFLDGVPIEGAASSFSLANIPVALAQSIEVYKGVVPTELGSDALGGAVNIVTRAQRGTLLDASATLGSYGLGKLSLLAQHQWRSGFGLRLQSYATRANNDYRVRVKNENLETSTLSATEGWYRRFHDHYAAEAVMVQAGWTDRPWADRLQLGLDYTQERADVQHAQLMKIVFGQKNRRSWGLTPRLVYAKRDFLLPQLDLNFSLRHDWANNTLIDTAAAHYNWAGERLNKLTSGEGTVQHKLLHTNTTAAVLGLKWRSGAHFLSLNHTLTYFTRRSEELSLTRATLSLADEMRRTNLKNVTGIEYKFSPSYHWTALLMAKHYGTQVRGPVLLSPTGRRPYYEEQSHSQQSFGYGAAATYRPDNVWQAKLSYERALRLPNVRELFGDGDLENGAAQLRPEQSHNLNLNLRFEPRFSRRHALSLEVGSTLRQVSDYIIRTIDERTGAAVSSNFGRVRAWGIDLGLDYHYNRRLSLTAAYAYLSLRNAERLTASGAPSVNYNQRVPNVPFSHGNADVSYRFDQLGRSGLSLTLSYGLDFSQRFYRAWAGDGARLYIPSQCSQRAAIVLGAMADRLTLALEGDNLSDALLYDNYSLQKPGRSLSAKLRYLFRK